MPISDGTRHEDSRTLAAVEEVRRAINACEEVLNAQCIPGRRRSLALTHLETAAMFAVKAAAVGDK